MLEQAIAELTTEVQKLRETLERHGIGPVRPSSSAVPAPLLLRPAEAAALLGISRGTAYNLLASGRLPHIRLGRTIRIPHHALQNLILQETRMPAT